MKIKLLTLLVLLSTNALASDPLREMKFSIDQTRARMEKERHNAEMERLIKEQNEIIWMKNNFNAY